MPAIDSLFNPFTLKSLSTENRVVMAPMTRNHSPDNIPSEASVAYYRRRAAGGVGLIITEGTCPNHIAANGYPDVPYFHGEERLAGWKKIVDAVHAEGGKIAPQLWHCGGMRKRGTMPEGEERPWTAKPMVPMGPSKTEYAGSDSAKYTFNEGEKGHCPEGKLIGGFMADPNLGLDD